MRASLADWLRVLKIPVAFLSGAAAVMGCAAFDPSFMQRIALSGAGVFFLSCGAAALNNIQDRFIDGQRARTLNRPLASGRILVRHAALLSILLLLSGTVGLFIASRSWKAPLAGLLAVILYNALYTPLKRTTPWALLPGVLSGAFPPLIGWLAAGGGLLSLRIGLVLVLYGTWQIPHLWLVMLAHRCDYFSPVERRIVNFFEPDQLQRLIPVWVTVFAFLTLLLKVFNFIDGPAGSILLLVNAVVLPAVFFTAFRKQCSEKKCKALFMLLNLSVLGITVMTGVDCLVR